MSENEKNSIFRIFSAILNEEIILVTEKNELSRALEIAKKENLILYTPGEIAAMDGILPEELPALHLAKKKLNAKIVANFKEKP